MHIVLRVLLLAIIERVSGLSYGEFLEARLFRPLGMSHTYYAHDRRVTPGPVEGYSIQAGVAVGPEYMSMTVPHAAGAVASTADDLLRWHRALRDGTAIPRHLREALWVMASGSSFARWPAAARWPPLSLDLTTSTPRRNR